MPRERIYTAEPTGEGETAEPGQLIEITWRRGLGYVEIATMHECPTCERDQTFPVHISEPHLIGKLKRVITRAGEQSFMDVPD